MTTNNDIAMKARKSLRYFEGPRTTMKLIIIHHEVAPVVVIIYVKLSLGLSSPYLIQDCSVRQELMQINKINFLISSGFCKRKFSSL